MRNTTTCSMVLLALCLCGASCSSGQKASADPALTALDKAYSAGVLTKDEYEAKRSALLAKSGAAKQSATNSKPSSPASGKPGSTAPAVADGHTFRMQMAKVMDSQGFERPIVSATMLIPVDWQYQAATTWNIRDSCNTIRTTMRASGPDGRAFELFPTYSWTWADDPTFLRQSAAQAAQFGTHACDVTPPVSAADYIRANLGKIRPGAALAGFEQTPELMQKLQQQAQQGQQMAAQYGLQQQIRPDGIKARIKYTVDGKPVEEWIVVAIVTTATVGPSYDPRTLRMIQARSYNCQATAIAERAPAGQLDSSEKLFNLMVSTFRADAAWQARVTQNAQQIQQTQLKGVQDRSRIIAQNGQDISNIINQGYENRQRIQDQSFAEFDQVIRGVETYQNPNTGERVELDSTYGNAWVNNQGQYLLTDQAGFDPNTAFQNSWTQLKHVKPQP